MDTSTFPLATGTNETLSKLCEALWGWQPCAQWVSEKCCSVPECTCRRAARLTPFFDFYHNATALYLPDDVGDTNPALGSHDDLLEIIVLLLRDGSRKPRSQLTAEFFAGRQGCVPPPLSDQNRAFNLAARIITMVQPAADQQSDGLLEAGMAPAVWHDSQTLASFIGSVFPQRDFPSLGGGEVSPAAKIQVASITARRLKKVAGLDVVPTDDLRHHLAMDEKKGTVAVFPYTSVLREHLAATAASSSSSSSSPAGDKHPSVPASPDDTAPGSAAPRGGAIPQQLALETLATLKEVLFPDDAASQAALRALVARRRLDPDITRVADTTTTTTTASPMAYQYWGARLMDLHDELENPTPRGLLWTWMERRSGARYVMMATLAGVAIAVVLGILSLAVSIFQAWVSWQQWQHPITSSP